MNRDTVIDVALYTLILSIFFACLIIAHFLFIFINPVGVWGNLVWLIISLCITFIFAILYSILLKRVKE